MRINWINFLVESNTLENSHVAENNEMHARKRVLFRITQVTHKTFEAIWLAKTLATKEIVLAQTVAKNVAIVLK
jgi:hypothetical protein